MADIKGTRGQPDEGSLSPSSLQPLFRPRSVAVVGASDDAAKYGHKVLRNIIEGGFPGGEPAGDAGAAADDVIDAEVVDDEETK